MSIPLARTAVVLALAVASRGLAQPRPAPAPQEPVRGPVDPREVEAFIDGLATAYLRDSKIAGLTVAIVRDTAPLLVKGYGWADFDKRIPVDGARTMFRIGSITKTFTWTGIMQLVEQGKLSLDTDINQYLDFTIPATYPAPITLTHVLTHTPGLEEDARDLFTEDPAHITPMAQWLPAHMPKRVRPPGTFSSYSNWATGVAGYIIERASGQSWDDYLEQHIFAPLGMTVTTGRQPLPAAFAPDMSQGYRWSGGRWEAQPFEIVTGAAPAGSMAASAGDMAKFMIAHLNDGAYRGRRILGEATARQMHARLFVHDPRLNGFAHGFYEQQVRDPRIIGHGGDTQFMHSNMALVLDDKVGIFVSTNTDKGSEISFKPFLDDVLAHYYPRPLPALTPTAAQKAAALSVAGSYVLNRMSYTTFQKVFALLSPITVRATADSALVAATPFGPLRLLPAGDSLLFRDAVSQDMVACRADAGGTVQHCFLGMAPMMVMERVAGASAPMLHYIINALGYLVFAGTLVAAAMRFFGRRTGPRGGTDPTIVRGRRTMAVVSLLMLGFLGGMAAVASNPMKLLLSDSRGALNVVLLLPVLAALLTLAALWFAIGQWRRGEGNGWMRFRHLGAVVLTTAVLWSFHHWNLLGWHY